MVVGTACSGTDSPIMSLRLLVGAGNIQHVFSCDRSEISKVFVFANVPPLHWYASTEDLVQSTATCATCGPGCAAMQTELDIFVCGRPCELHSNMNPARWTNNPDQLWTKSATKPFLDVSKFIRCKRPKVVILENVKSLSHGSDKIPAPIEFVMHGTLKVKHEGKARKVEVGLALIPGYAIHDAIFNAMDCGLPSQARTAFH